MTTWNTKRELDPSVPQMVLRKAAYRHNASFPSAKTWARICTSAERHPAPNTWCDKKISLTFSLDLKHADGILRVERPHLAGGQRVSPLDARRDGRCGLHGFDERLRANYGHHTTRLSVSPSPGQKTPLVSSPSRRSPLSDPEDDRTVCVYL